MPTKAPRELDKTLRVNVDKGVDGGGGESVKVGSDNSGLETIEFIIQKQHARDTSNTRHTQ